MPFRGHSLIHAQVIYEETKSALKSSDGHLKMSVAHFGCRVRIVPLFHNWPAPELQRI